MSSSDSSSSSSSGSYRSDKYDFRPKEQNRVARKSTASSTAQTPNYTTRRQAALAISKQQQQHQKLHNKNLRSGVDRFLENFNPDTSTREKRKLIRKINPPSNVRRPPGALYDEHGIHVTSGIDLCDCLNEECVGCFFECEKCGTQKCGIDCRMHRKYMYDQIEYHGYDIVIKNPLIKH